MTVLTVGSVMGAPGATTTALALVRHRRDRAVLLEADPDGGRLALLLDMDHRPGLVDLLTSTRDMSPDDVFGWVQRPDPRSGAPLVVAHPSADIVHRALRAGVDDLTHTLEGAPFDVVCDVGRYRVDSAASALTRMAAWRVVVTHGSLVALAVLSHALEWLRVHGPVALVVSGNGPYGAEEVGRALGVPAVGLPAAGSPLPGRRFVRAIEDLMSLVEFGGAR